MKKLIFSLLYVVCGGCSLFFTVWLLSHLSFMVTPAVAKEEASLEKVEKKSTVPTPVVSHAVLPPKAAPVTTPVATPRSKQHTSISSAKKSDNTIITTNPKEGGISLAKKVDVSVVKESGKSPVKEGVSPVKEKGVSVPPPVLGKEEKVAGALSQQPQPAIDQPSTKKAQTLSQKDTPDNAVKVSKPDNQNSQNKQTLELTKKDDDNFHNNSTKEPPPKRIPASATSAQAVKNGTSVPENEATSVPSPPPVVELPSSRSVDSDSNTTGSARHITSDENALEESDEDSDTEDTAQKLRKRVVNIHNELNSVYNIDQHGRNPFKSFYNKKSVRKKISLTPAEQYSLKNMKLIGITWGSGIITPTALFKAPDGKMFYLQKNDRIGKRRSIVYVIREDEVIVVQPESSSTSVQAQNIKYTPIIISLSRVAKAPSAL